MECRDRVHAILKPVRGKQAVSHAEAVVAGGPYAYRWADGWCASVSARIIEGTATRRIRKASCGFAGYDWMVRSIWLNGEIKTPGRMSA